MATEVVVNQALCSLTLGEAQLVAGCLEEADRLAQGALSLARAHDERGHEAYALHLLGEIAMRRRVPRRALAEAHYRQALALAADLGMRPPAPGPLSLRPRYGVCEEGSAEAGPSRAVNGH